MDTLQNMRVFVRVVEGGTFTAAARHLNTTTAQASRAVSDLEAHLRTRLLHRTTRRIALTDAGQRYLRHCEQILACVNEAEAEARDARARPTGTLKVHAMTGFGQHYVVPLVSRYREHYPSVSIDLTLGQRIPDLLDEGYDIALVLTHGLADSGLVSQSLGTAYSIVCASPGYIRRYGLPETLSELEQHVCLQLNAPGGVPRKWVFDGPRGRETIALRPAPFAVNVAEAMATAIRDGMGIGVLPTSSALPHLRAGTLVRIFPEYTTNELQIFAVYPSRQYLDAKIRTWVEFLRETLPETLSIDAESLQQFVMPSAHAV